jgi:catechol 2,3-dioxygenase-like lactoylglutathione lyase family enzyme
VFDHVTIRVSDRPASERFYATLLDVLGRPKTHDGGDVDEWDDFSLLEDGPPTKGLHIGFRAPSREHVDEFWRLGVGAGCRDDGPPGLRPQYGPEYYGAFVLDPEGNSVEAVHRDGMRRDGTVDHLWIRVADLPQAKQFYETIAPYAGFRLRADLPDRAHFGAGNGAFAVVDGAPAENVHMAFPAATDAAVDAFHRAATQAGYADNGPPGERSAYHRGYYAAFVLDPDGNNIELVNHHRER